MKYFKWLLFEILLLVIVVMIVFFFNSTSAANTSQVCKNVSGVWKNDVLGKIITFECKGASYPIIATYHFAKNSIVLQGEPKTIEGDELKLIHHISENKLRIGDDVFYRIHHIPVSKPVTPGTALQNCEILTDYFQQHYGFFNLRKIDFNKWKKQCNQSKHLDPVGQDFFNLIKNMLSQFKDNHILLSKNIESGAADYFGYDLREPFAKQLTEEAEKYNKEHHTLLSNSDYVDGVLIPQVKKYLLTQVDLKKSIHDGSVFWGTLKSDPNVIYFYVSSMQSDALDQVNELVLSMIEYATLHHLSGMIIDMRFNQGGDEVVAQDMTSYFVDHEKIIHWRQFFYNGNTWTKPQPMVIQPKEKHFNRFPIVMLISPITASAAESFSLGMSSLPQVKLIGENSMGIFSDQFVRRLPNGWWITLSNEKILSADQKISYEKIGLPLFETTPFPFLTNLVIDGDAGIKNASIYIQNNFKKNEGNTDD